MLAVHLGVMELEGDGQRGFQPAFTVAPPGEERIGEDAAVLVDDAVKFCACYSRRADDGGFIVQNVLTSLADGLRQVLVVGIKRLQVVADSHVAEAESALYIICYHIDGHTVVFVQFPSYSRRAVALGQHVKFLNLCTSTAAY